MKQIVLLIMLSFVNLSVYSTGLNLVIPKISSTTEKFAAEELQKYLEKITNKELKINTSEVSGSYNIFVKNSSKQEKKTLDYEDYIIESIDGGIILSGGGNRGTLYAVYDFLENLGCRWYYMDLVDEVIPTLTANEVIKIASNLNVTESPDFSDRIFQFQAYEFPSDFNFDEGEYAARLIDWLTKNRFNIFQYGLDNKRSYDLWPDFKKHLFEFQKRDMVIGISGHSHFLFIPDSVFDSHEDWWPEKNGQRVKAGQFCTSNAEAVNFYIKNILKFLKENREITYFSAWPADTNNGDWCNCELCGDDSLIPDKYLKLSNKIASEISKEVPSITFVHFAYGSHLEAPKNEKLLLEMPVTVAAWGRDFDDNFYNMSAKNGYKGNHLKEDFVKEFDEWRRISASTNSPLILHEKYLRHRGLVFTPLPLKILSGDMKFFKEQKLAGFELPMGYMGIRTKALNLYATAKLMWNTEAIVKEIEEDYFKRFYGESGSIMRNSYEQVVLAQPNLKYFFKVHKLDWHISPIDTYSSNFKGYIEENYAANALYHFNLAQKYLHEALLLNTGNVNIKERIKRFEKSLDYIKIEYEGLFNITETIYHVQKADTSIDSLEKYIELQFAQQYLDVVQKKSDKRRKLIRENDIQFFWDVDASEPKGVFSDSDIPKLQQIINEKMGFN